jgi:UDP:flavonoid glycosyltransferase YjiC (YdhE family)
LGNLPLPATVLAIDAVPHSWLLPQVAAVVHHGGAGVTAAALRAGVPSVVVPVFGDQTFWAERVHALGVAPHPIPRRHLTSHNLAAAMQQAIADPTLRARCQPLAASLQAEDGVAAAIRWLEAQSGFSAQ